MIDRRPRESGFTLVELMVTLAIVAVITVQALAMMTGQEQLYHAQKRALESQTDARLIADLAMRDIRSSGFMLPPIVGISSRDGGNQNPDVLCTSDTATIDEDRAIQATDRFGGAPLTADLAAGNTVLIADADKDIDGDSFGDFVVGSGIIVSDGIRTHCARVQSLGSDKIQFTPGAPSGFVAAIPDARAVPAVIYEITSAGLTRNTILITPGVEDFQVRLRSRHERRRNPHWRRAPHRRPQRVRHRGHPPRAALGPRANRDGGSQAPDARQGPASPTAIRRGISDRFRRRLSVTVGGAPRNLL